jgi:hypothetical protein
VRRSCGCRSDSYPSAECTLGDLQARTAAGSCKTGTPRNARLRYGAPWHAAPTYHHVLVIGEKMMVGLPRNMVTSGLKVINSMHTTYQWLLCVGLNAVHHMNSWLD